MIYVPSNVVHSGKATDERDVVFFTVKDASHSLHGIKATRWSWHLYVRGPETVVRSGGHAETPEDAKAAVERNWQAWLAAAALREN